MTLKSYNFWRYGVEYFESYKILKTHKPNMMNLTSVKFYLLGHSLECLLKAYLVSLGYSPDKLKNEYGHNLELLIAVSLINGLKNKLNISAEEIKIIKLLNIYYCSKQFEYHKKGSKTFPYMEDVEEIIENLIDLFPWKKLGRAMK
jgi:hypothetical protein